MSLWYLQESVELA